MVRLANPVFKFQTDEELDPDDVELDEHYIYETRSKCKLKVDLYF